jgi:hypothetical protein
MSLSILPQEYRVPSMNTRPRGPLTDIPLGGERLFPLSLSTGIGESNYPDGT